MAPAPAQLCRVLWEQQRVLKSLSNQSHASTTKDQEKKINALMLQLTDVKAQRNDAVQKHQEALQALEQANTDASKALRRAIADGQRREKLLSQKVDSLVARATAAEEERDSLTKQLDQRDAELSRARARIRSLQARVDDTTFDEKQLNFLTTHTIPRGAPPAVKKHTEAAEPSPGFVPGPGHDLQGEENLGDEAQLQREQLKFLHKLNQSALFS